jgi:photosystem II stability/assembly factor-like uncharacterized protein
MHTFDSAGGCSPGVRRHRARSCARRDVVDSRVPGDARNSCGARPRNEDATMQEVSRIGRRARRARRIAVVLCGVVSLASSAAHGGTWTTSQGPVGGRMSSLAIDPTSPSTVYLGTSFSGVFKSLDSGRSWAPLPTGIESISAIIITGLAVDPATPSNVYASATVGLGGGVLRSSDGGAHWSFVDLSETFAIAIDPVTPTTLYAGGSPKMLKSTDAGVTWTPLEVFGAFGIAVDPVTPSTVYAANGGVLKSLDGGATWKGTGGIAGTALAMTLAIDPTVPTTIYAGTTGGVFKSIDGGDHWTSLGPVADHGFGLDTLAIAIDAANPSVVYAAGLASDGFGVYKSTDGGAHWMGTPIPSTTNALVLSTSSTLIAGTTDTGVFLSTDGATTWNLSNTGLAATDVLSLAVDPAHPGKIYAGTERNLTARSADGGATWTAMAPFRSLFGVTSLAVDPTATGTVYAGNAVGDGVFKSIDDGATWTRLLGPVAPLDAYALALDPTNPQVVYAGGLQADLMSNAVGVTVSQDGGSSWTPMGNGLVPFVVSLAIDPTAPATIYAGGGAEGPFKTIDGGAHWTRLESGLPSNADTGFFLTIDPAHPMTLYGAIPGAGVFKTTDGGATWNAVNNGLGSLQVGALAVDAIVTDTVYAGTFDQGVFTTLNGGASWSATNDGLFNPRVRSLAVEPGRVYAGTDGNGVFAMDVNTTPTAVVLGQGLTIMDPKPGEGGDPSRRKIRVAAKESTSNDALDAVTLAQNGATVTITTFGANPSSQTFAMPAPWKRLGTTGATYSDPRGVNGPVKRASVKRSSSGVFEIRLRITGKVSGDVSQPQMIVVPPNPGAGARVDLQITDGAPYCVGFGGPAGGQLANAGARSFTVSRPTAALCP